MDFVHDRLQPDRGWERDANRGRHRFLALLTGKPATTSKFPDSLSADASTPEDAKNKLKDLLAAHSPIVVFTSSRAQEIMSDLGLGSQIVNSHAHEIIGMTADGRFQLSNPWGRMDPPPMTIEQLMRVMNPEYAHLAADLDADVDADAVVDAEAAEQSESFSITAVEVPGTTFVAGLTTAEGSRGGGGCRAALARLRSGGQPRSGRAAVAEGGARREDRPQRRERL